MRQTITLLSFLLVTAISGQSTADFEIFNLNDESFLYGNDESGGFEQDLIFLPNNYNAGYDSWTGWAISNTTDTTTPGYLNQYSCIAGSGHNSETYAVSYVLGESKIIFDENENTSPKGFYINNSTFTYLSMRDGDGFAKKFGGATGDDPDYYLLTIRNYQNGVQTADSINFYLADYRSENNDEDYIIDEWTYVDVSSLGASDSLSFFVSSTDNGLFGMNTPAYFCIDDFTTEKDPVAVKAEETVAFDFFPNPVSDQLIISINKQASGHILLVDNLGRIIRKQAISSQIEIVDMSSLQAGIYTLQVHSSEIITSEIVLKK